MSKYVSTGELESAQAYPLQPWELQKEKDGYPDCEEETMDDCVWEIKSKLAELKEKLGVGNEANT